MKLEFGSKEEFLSHIAGLPLKDRYTELDLLNDKFRIYRDGSVDIYYTPFDYMNLVVSSLPGKQRLSHSRFVFHGTGDDPGRSKLVGLDDLPSL